MRTLDDSTGTVCMQPCSRSSRRVASSATRTLVVSLGLLVVTAARADEAPDVQVESEAAVLPDAPVEEAPPTPSTEESAAPPVAAQDRPPIVEPTAEPTSGNEAPSVLVLNLEAANVDDVTVKILDGMIESAVARQRGLRVVSSGEIARIIEIEGNKQALGCVQDSCLSELAGAMGTRYVLFGHVAPLGETLVMQLRLFDSQTLVMVAREELKGPSPDVLATAIPPAVDTLFASIATPAVVEKSDDEVPTMAWVLLGSGGAVILLAGVVVVGSAAVATYGFLTLTNATAPRESKDMVVNLMTPSVVGVVVGAALAAGGGALALSTFAFLDE